MIVLIVGILFFIGAIYNLVYTGNTLEATVGLLIGLLTEIIYFIKIRGDKENERFINWLIENQKDILKGYAEYNGKKMDVNMELVQFQACLSFLFVSFRMPSRFYIKGYHKTKIIGIAYALISLIFGWWGLPWGPVYTVQSVIKNITGGNRQKLHDLLANDLAPEIR